MTVIRLRYIDRFRDRHGKLRLYFRRPGGQRTPLPGQPGSKEFRTAYEAALGEAPAPIDTRKQSAVFSFDWLLPRYFNSMRYLSLRPQTQRAYRLVIERIVREENIGHRLVSQMRREHVEKMMAKRSKTPAAANDALKKVKILVRFAIENGWRADDPTLHLKKFEEGEHHSWLDSEIAQYESKWPLGTRERLAFALLLHTGQRLSDVSKMVWGDIENNAIRVVQNKTRAKLVVPLHPELASALAVSPKKHVAILTTSYGRPFSDKGLGNWMADKIERAGLPTRCVAHGLRKAAARRLADAGCSANQIAAITGHTTLKEVSRYTRAAEQRGLAVAAFDNLKKHKSNKDSQT